MEDEWGDKVRMARSLHHELEYLMVKHQKRKCATMHITPRNYDVLMERIQQDGLVWLPEQRTKSYSGFSHKHFPTDHIDMNTSVYGDLSYDIKYAEEFRNASGDKNTDHKVIGELLGFPECCSQFFIDAWTEGYFDPLYQAAVYNKENYEQIDERRIKIKPHIATNQFLRYYGFRLTSHFPCSPSCEESIKVGKDWYNLAKKHRPTKLKYLEEILCMPAKWSINHGVAIVTTYPFTLLANSLPTKKEWVIEWDEVETY
jgi:hypothetical protein